MNPFCSKNVLHADGQAGVRVVLNANRKVVVYFQPLGNGGAFEGTVGAQPHTTAASGFEKLAVSSRPDFNSQVVPLSDGSKTQ